MTLLICKESSDRITSGTSQISAAASGPALNSSMIGQGEHVCLCVLRPWPCKQGVLSWRLREEAMAGGRLAHTPQCDQQKKHLLWT